MLAGAFEDGLFAVARDDVGEDEKLDLGGGGHLADLIGGGVVALEAGGDLGGIDAVEVLGQVDFVDENVDALRMLDEVLARARVAGDDYGVEDATRG